MDTYILVRGEMFHGNISMSEPEEISFAFEHEVFDFALNDMRMWMEEGIEFTYGPVMRQA